MTETINEPTTPVEADRSGTAAWTRVCRAGGFAMLAWAVALQLIIGEVVPPIAVIGVLFGGMAAIPKRAVQTEQWLQGRDWNEASVREAMQCLRDEFSPLSDMRASAGYRSRATANLLYRFYLETRPQAALSATDVNVFAVNV